MLLGKAKLNAIEPLIYKTLIDSYMSHDKFVGNMINISRKACERNGVETIVDSDGVLRLNQKHIEGLDHKELRLNTVK